MSYDNGASYELKGRIYPSLRAMIRANKWCRKIGQAEPYPDLTSYYDPSLVEAALARD